MEKLPDSLRTVEPLAPMLRVESLRSDPFLPTDSRLLQQAIWLRDISDWAKGMHWRMWMLPGNCWTGRFAISNWFTDSHWNNPKMKRSLFIRGKC